MYLVKIEAGVLYPPTAVSVSTILRISFLRKLEDDTITKDSVWPNLRSRRGASLNHVSFPPGAFPRGLRVTWGNWRFPLETKLGYAVAATADYFRAGAELPTSAELVSTAPESSFYAVSDKEFARRTDRNPAEWLSDSYAGRIDFRFIDSSNGTWTVRSLSELELAQAELPLGSLQPPEFQLISDPTIADVNVASPRILLYEAEFCNERGQGWWRESMADGPVESNSWVGVTRFGGLFDRVQDFDSGDFRTRLGGYVLNWTSATFIDWTAPHEFNVTRRHCFASEPPIFLPDTVTTYKFYVSGCYPFETARAPGSTGGPVGIWPRKLR